MPTNPVEKDVFSSIANRWSPYRFDPRPVESEKLLSCFEAARWASSSFNDQPWSWIVARREDSEAFEKMLDVLMEANRPWAKNAGAIALSVIRTSFQYNNQPNRVALHDLGQAAGFLSLQATDFGLQVHQMAGINLSVARQTYGIPDGHEPQTAIAIGYPSESEPITEEEQGWAKREQGARKRLPLSQQLFEGSWGTTGGLTG